MEPKSSKVAKTRGKTSFFKGKTLKTHGESPIFETWTTKDGKRLQDVLESEDIAMLLPCDPLKAQQGTYQHMRAAAETIATSTLAKELPQEWQQLHSSVILDDEGVE